MVLRHKMRESIFDVRGWQDIQFLSPESGNNAERRFFSTDIFLDERGAVRVENIGDYTGQIHDMFCNSNPVTRAIVWRLHHIRRTELRKHNTRHLGGIKVVL